MMDRRELLNDNEEALRLAFEGQQGGLWTAMPGIVKAVDLTHMTLSIQPAIQGIIQLPDGTNQNVNLPLLINVPIVFPSAGGFSITFPVAVNDEVLVVFASRCIDSWWQSGGIGVQVEQRMHDLSDGFAIPGPHSQAHLVSGISSTNLQIRNNSNTAHVEITPAGAVNILTASTVTLTGDLNVTGAITATTVTAGGVGLTTHHHSGVTTGAGITGGPSG
jgi:hypothetical protein